MRKLECLRCGGTVTFLLRDFFQKGDCSTWVGNLNFSLHGGLEMEVYSCPQCGKLEFFMPDWQEEIEISEPVSDELPPQQGNEITRINRDGIPQIRCRACGKEHDFDYPECPYCGYKQNL